MLVFFFILINIFYLPLFFSFSPELITSIKIILEDLPSYVFVFEICLNFNTAFYKNGIV